MDVNNIQRANLMIKELTKHGRVDSFESAVSEAQGMYGSIPGNEVIPEQQTEQISISGAIETEKSPQIDEESMNRLLKEKLGAVLSAYNDGIMGEIDSLKAQIESMRHKLMTATPARVQQSAVSQTPVDSQQTLPKQPVPQSSPQPHHGHGSYTSDDVSVEKMFYCGTN